VGGALWAGADHPPSEADAQKRRSGQPSRTQVWRATVALALARTVASSDLVSVDEAGATCARTRLSARAPRGGRAIGSVPRTHGTPTTLISALAPDGIPAALTRPGAIDTLAFRAVVEKVLAPTLHPGPVVVIDNRSVHHDPLIEELIDARDCLVVFLPSYPPDLSPIEQVFAKITASLRTVGARTWGALDQAIVEAIASVTLEDIRGFFRHAGYSLSVQT
jgi:transposase